MSFIQLDHAIWNDHEPAMAIFIIKPVSNESKRFVYYLDI